MMIHKERFSQIQKECEQKNVRLVAVSKTKPVEAIRELYELGHRDFGENYVQELVDKHEQLPADIRWHFIGHLQSNKAKYIVPFVHLIHGIDSFKLLREVNKQAAKAGRVVDVLLQMHIAQEETKFGLDRAELGEIMNATELGSLENIRVRGLIGMASFTDNQEKVRREFGFLKSAYDQYAAFKLPNVQFDTLSMGMSGDYRIAMEEGSNMIRVGSLIFGERNYS